MPARLAIVALVVLAAAAAAATPAGAAQRPLTMGFGDIVFHDGPTEQRRAWLDRARNVGARRLRIQLSWEGVTRSGEPARPDDPDDPAYDWRVTDEAIKDAIARGLRPVVLIESAPEFAEGPNRPEPFPFRTRGWMPDPVALGAFVRAASRRYSGRHPDPTRTGGRLPRVRDWIIWNEPNLFVYLAPQWVRVRGQLRPFAPAHYRRMLNAAYRALKATHRDNLVVTAGTAPFGDLERGGDRMPPVHFVRELLCMDARTQARRPCADPARFDVLAHHPTPVGSPSRRSLNFGDMTISDAGAKLRPILRLALRRRTLRPLRPKRLWAPEVSYDSSPPDPRGIPEAEHARYLSETMFRLWDSGFDTVLWYLIRDEDSFDGSPRAFNDTRQSGVFLRSGEPKLAARAFRFPFVVAPRSGRRLAWGRAPRSGVVTLQRRSRGAWRTVRRVRVGSERVFAVRLRTRAGTYRAIAGGEMSLEWRSR